MATTTPPTVVEAKIVVLGSQGVGKTSLVHRYVKNAFIPPAKAQSTVGASFLTTRVDDAESGTTTRLQIWDTAGQERFRSISKLYYRGAHVAILCYDVTSQRSFEEMGRWMTELRDQCGTNGALGDMIIHVVGTKSDVVAADPTKRRVPFEQCLEYVAEHLRPPGTTRQPSIGQSPGGAHGTSTAAMASPKSNRSSGFWGAESMWDCCHEVSSKDGEGIEEVFRVITKKLVEQHNKRLEATMLHEAQGKTPGIDRTSQQGYFDDRNGSFRLGHGDKRRSWLGFPTTPGGFTSVGGDTQDDSQSTAHRAERGRCC